MLMQNIKGSQGILFIYALFVAIISMLVLRGMLLSPSESDRAIFFGLSIPRLILSLGLLVTFIFFALITIMAWRDHEWAERTLEKWFGGGNFSRVITWFAGISLGLGWIGCFLPPYRVGILTNYWISIRPLMIFILVMSLTTLAVIVIKRSRLRMHHLKISKTHSLTILLFIISLLILGTMFYSGFGIRLSDDFWYGAGVPILSSQLILVIACGILVLHIEKRFKSGLLDVIIFLLTYLLTAILWVHEPLQASFVFPGPHPPSHVLYPYADAATFDSASQFALIGQGILNGQSFERSLYASFLVFLHTLAGQDYEKMMAIQAGIFAIFPALIYLIGRSLNIRAVGFAAASLAIWRGINAIAASSLIDMANPKMILTDFPAAIAMAIIILLTCEWLKSPAQKSHYPLWIGGAIGFGFILRTNILILLVFIPLYAFFKLSTERKKWLISSFLILLGVIVITLPWELRNQSRGGVIYGSYLAKFQFVIQQRYLSPTEPGGSLPEPNEHGLAPISLKSTNAILEMTRSTTDIGQDTKLCNTVACFAPNHFLHNIVTSILVLPTSLQMDDLRHTVKDIYPYWRPDWDGSFTALSLFFFLLNVFFIVLGVSIAWDKLHLPGLAPLAIFIFYNISTGLGRTSGGRYLVPMDWIISIYFLLGVFYLITWFANNIGIQWELFSTQVRHEGSQNPNSFNLSRVTLILAALFGLGSLIPLSESFYQSRYQDTNATQALMEHEQEVESAGLSMSDIDLFLKNPNAELLIGRILYPRYYPIDRGEIFIYPYVTMGFPRTAFSLIGPHGDQGVVLPGDVPKYFPHAADALVLGCNEEKYLDALAVILLDDSGAIYTRSPKSDLQCPLKQPVCNSNRVCR
jgi:hypothetical protein